MGKYISIRSGATALPEESVAHFVHDLLYQSGVLNPSTHWKVSEHSPQGMSVDIATGRGFFRKTTMTYHGYSDAIETVTITANSSGNPRIDSIVAYVDLSATPDSNASNVLTMVTVAGTPASSPTAPDSTAILASIGAGNPYIVLANIAVADSASSIINANITDVRPAALIQLLGGLYGTEITAPTGDVMTKDGTQTGTNKTFTTPIIASLYQDAGKTKLMTVPNVASDTFALLNAVQTLLNKRITKRVYTEASNAAPTPNCDDYDVHEVTTLAEAATIGAPTGTPTNKQPLIIYIKDNGTARALAFNAAYRFSSDLSAPTTTTLSKVLYLGFMWNSNDSKWDCLAVGNNY